MIVLRHPLAVPSSRRPWQEIEASFVHALAKKVPAGKSVEDSDLFGALAGKPVVPQGEIPITVESVHTGVQVPLSVSPRVSVKWLSDRARLVAGLKEEAQTGAYEDLKLRWVLVDAKAEGEWKALSRRQQQQVHAMLMPDTGLSVSRSSDDRMSDLGIYPGIVFHLVAVPDEAAPLPHFRPPSWTTRPRRARR